MTLPRIFKLRVRHPALFLILSLLLTIGSLPVFVRELARSSSSQDRAYLEKIRNQLAGIVGANIAGMENLSYQFIANFELNRMLESYTASEELYQIADWNKTFSAFLESHERANPILRDAVFCDTAEPRRKPLTMSDHLSSEILRNVRSSPFFRRILEGDGRAVWDTTSVLEHDGRKSLLCGRAVKNISGSRLLGVLVFLVRTERLAEIVNSELYVDGEPPEDSVGNYFNLLVAGDGRILSSPMKSHTGSMLPKVFGETDRVTALLAAGSAGGNAELYRRDEKVFAVFRRIENSGFFLLEITTRPPPAPANTAGLIFAAAAFLSGSAGGLLIVRGSRRNRRPFDGAEEPATPGEPPPWLVSLPPREQEILLMVADGRSNKEIAFELGLKEQTVKNYTRSIYEKLGIHDRVSASLLVTRYGLSREKISPHS